MLQRYDVLEAENSSLRQQLATATVRASELSMSNEQLLKSLERHRGALEVVRCCTSTVSSHQDACIGQSVHILTCN